MCGGGGGGGNLTPQNSISIITPLQVQWLLSIGVQMFTHALVLSPFCASLYVGSKFTLVPNLRYALM